MSRLVVLPLVSFLASSLATWAVLRLPSVRRFTFCRMGHHAWIYSTVAFPCGTCADLLATCALCGASEKTPLYRRVGCTVHDPRAMPCG